MAEQVSKGRSNCVGGMQARWERVGRQPTSSKCGAGSTPAWLCYSALHRSDACVYVTNIGTLQLAPTQQGQAIPQSRMTATKPAHRGVSLQLIIHKGAPPPFPQPLLIPLDALLQPLRLCRKVAPQLRGNQLERLLAVQRLGGRAARG